MKKNKGKILIGLIALIIAVCIFVSVLFVEKAHAGNVAAHKYVFDGEYTNPCIVFYDSDATSETCGMVRDKTTGIAETSETYAANALTVGSGIAKDDQSDRWVADVPTLPSGKNKTVIIITDSASPTKTDIPVYQDFYDPSDI